MSLGPRLACCRLSMCGLAGANAFRQQVAPPVNSGAENALSIFKVDLLAQFNAISPPHAADPDGHSSPIDSLVGLAGYGENSLATEASQRMVHNRWPA